MGLLPFPASDINRDHLFPKKYAADGGLKHHKVRDGGVVWTCLAPFFCFSFVHQSVLFLVPCSIFCVA